MSRLAMVCLLAAGCIDIKSFPGNGPVGGSGEVHAVQSGDGSITVTGPNYSVHFPGTGSGFPDDIVVGTTHVLASSATCTDPSGTGVQIAPVASTSASTAATSNLTLASPGPVVARVVIIAPLALGSCGDASVSSAWSFFPDGRISRFDQVTGNGSFMTSCACGPPGLSGFTVRVETLLARASYTALEAPDGAGVSPTPAGNENAGDIICLDNPGFELVLYDAPGPLPILYSVGTSADLGVVYNIGGSPTADLADAHYGLSGMVIAPPAASCQATLTKLAPYQRYVELVIDGSAMDNTNYDGIAGGFTTTPGEFGYPVTANQITFAPTIPTGQPASQYVAAPPGFAIGMAFGGAHPTYVATNKAGRTLTIDEAKFQALDAGGRVVLWLRDGIGFDDAITVTAQ
jgi:hypothetical protein